MTPRRFYLRREWRWGMGLAASGVALARMAGVLAVSATRMRAGLALAGELIALAGLFAIAFGVSRRSRATTPPPP